MFAFTILNLTYSYDPLKASLLANVILNTIMYLKETLLMNTVEITWIKLIK